ncbi:MAG: HNH endonuclease [Candidatus Bathyarchaeia archaeon]
MTEIQCVYCMQIKPLSSYLKTEHVIPQSFGTFVDNITLNQHVCDDCNQYFGDNLEIDLARDTFEGLSRFDHGVKQPSEFKSLGQRSRLTLKVSEGQFQGALVYLEYSPDTNKLMIRPIRQIGFFHPENTRYSYFPLDKIPHKSELEEQGFDLTRRNAVRALGISSERAKKILTTKGIILRSWGDAEDLEPTKNAWNVEVEGYIDTILFRAIAKTAFNYFAYWQGAVLARQTEFDVIRSYIREGVQPSYPLVSILPRPILADESDVGQRRLGHIITLNWSADRKSIVSMISFFNLITYSISVSRNYSGEIRDLTRGHFFDIVNRQIIFLQSM